MRKKIVAGNWKMNMNHQEALALYNGLVSNETQLDENVQVIVAPPSIYLSEFSQIKTNRIRLAAQNCSEHEKGAYTGELSAGMLVSIGVQYCLVGHSERREYFGETNELLKEKVNVLLENNRTPIYCFGEVLAEREAGNHFNTVKEQVVKALFHLDETQITKVILAYEPVWAIGTGVTASPEQAQEIHEFVRELLAEKYGQTIAEEISILYGGSCKPANAKELFANPDVDGGLIGGAALKTETFIPVVNGFLK
ncbi:MAG: triose-phosphate isomerase [Flavobacteriales bacterium]|jgi:triosephosphate isomerase|nr:triose-phosphate isomerase [Flavobacteriales bacterium]